MFQSATCPIFLINLPDKEDNLLRSLRELRKLKLFNNIIIKEAIDKKKAKELQFKYITKIAYNNIENNLSSCNILPTWGAVGCAISHMNCWEEIVNKNYEYAIICEDDIKVNNIQDFNYCYYNSLKYIQTNDPVFISFNSKIDTTYNVDMIQQFYGIFTGLSMYMINLNAAKNYLKLKPFTNQIDIEMSYNNYCLNCQSWFYKYGGISNFEHISSVQYYFLNFQELYDILKDILVFDVIKIIYSFLPTRDKLLEYPYGYHHNYNYHNNLGYNITYDV